MSLRFMVFLHGFVGIGAAAGGMSAVIDPSAPLGITTDALQFSPFSSFLIPGLFLLLILGCGNIAAGVISYRKPQYARYAGIGFGAVLMLWIVIQCIMLQSVVFLHVLFFLIGALQLLSGVKFDSPGKTR